MCGSSDVVATGGEILQRIDVEARIERGRDAERARRAEQQRIAVGIGGGGGLEADGGAGAGAVLDDDLLAERLSMIDWPVRRAMVSIGPPGGNGTIILIGLSG